MKNILFLILTLASPASAMNISDLPHYKYISCANYVIRASLRNNMSGKGLGISICDLNKQMAHETLKYTMKEEGYNESHIHEETQCGPEVSIEEYVKNTQHYHALNEMKTNNSLLFKLLAPETKAQVEAYLVSN